MRRKIYLFIQFLNLIALKKILSFTLLFAFQLVLFAQADMTSTLIKNGDFENGINTGWELELKGSAIAAYQDAGKTAAAYGGHAAKVEVTAKQFMHYVILKNSIPSGDHSGKILTYSVKAAALEKDLSSVMHVSAFGSDGSIIDYAMTQMRLKNNGNFKTFSLSFNVPANTDYIELVVWCGEKVGTYIFDDFTVN